MTIKNYKWSDKDIYCDSADNDEIELLSDNLIDQVFINKNDAKAIAQHFGLIGKTHYVEALIEEYDPPKDWKEPNFNNKAHRFDWKEYVDDLADEWHLLTDKQKIIISANAASRADMDAEHCFD